MPALAVAPTPTAASPSAALDWFNPWTWGSQTPAAAAPPRGGTGGAGGADLFGHYADGAGGGLAAAAAQVVQQMGDAQAAAGVFEAGTGGDAKVAVAALDQLTSLPPAMQGAAIDQMSDQAFADLMTSVPADQRERFATLFQSTGNERRKVQLWGEFHKSKAANDGASKQAEIMADASLSDDERRLRLEKLTAIRASTAMETDDEVANVLQEIETWEHPPSEYGPVCRLPGARPPVSVDELAERKAHEHDLEMRFGVNLTNSTGGRDGDGSPTSRAAWSDEELGQIESALGRLPHEATAGNDRLKEIRRIGTDWDEKAGKWKPKPDTGGTHSDGVITVTDAGIDGAMRHTGDTSELAGHHAGQDGPSGPVTALEETLTHEIGHDIADRKPDAYARFMAAAGWQSGLTEDDVVTRMMDAGLSEEEARAQVADMQAGRGDTFSERTEAVAGNDVLAIDPYDPRGVGFQSRLGGAVPGDDYWNYAASNPDDHFAETYAKAVHVPEVLHEDLIAVPQKGIETFTANVVMQEAELEALQASGADAAAIAAAESELAATRDRLARIEEVALSRAEQYRIMREEVFGVTDDSVDDAFGSVLKAAGKGKAGKAKARALEAQFRAEADKAMTPQQLEALSDRYEGML